MSWFDKKIKPMLAVKGKPFSDDNFIYEVKWDGTRAIAFVDLEKDRLRIQNRRLFEIAHRYPEIDLLDSCSESTILDGEIVVFDRGLPSFSFLQMREHVDSKFKASILAKKMPATYVVFDAIYTASKGFVNDLPLMKRKRILEGILRESRSVILADFVEGEGEKFYGKVVELGLEGIVGKNKGGKYVFGERSPSWVKIKKRQTIDCVIVGWLEGEGERKETFASLILAAYSEGKLVHLGQVGTGFEEDFALWFAKKLREIEIKTPHFKIDASRNVHWCMPRYVCEVEFLEFTKDLKLRAPVFLRLRDDKAPEDCTLDRGTASLAF